MVRPNLLLTLPTVSSDDTLLFRVSHQAIHLLANQFWTLVGSESEGIDELRETLRKELSLRLRVGLSAILQGPDLKVDIADISPPPSFLLPVKPQPSTSLCRVSIISSAQMEP
jgi:hypothetical protein